MRTTPPCLTQNASTSATRGSAELRGYALPMVVLLATILAVGMGVLLSQLGSSATTTSGHIKRRQAFYAADGVARVAMEVASERLLRLPPPSSTTLADPSLLAAFHAAQMAVVQSDLDASRPTITPAGYSLSALTITSLGTRSLQMLTNGPFAGMQAQVQPFTITTELGHTDLERGANVTMSAAVQRGTLSMFQFFAFIDGYAYLYSGPGARIAGRIHANGNICMGSDAGLYIEKITTAGSYYTAQSSGCREKEYTDEAGDEHQSAKTEVWIANSPMSNGIADLTIDSKWTKAALSCSSFSTCAQEYDRDGPTMTNLPAGTWATTALNRWNGQLQDQTHGVPQIKVPVMGTPVVQRGRNASHLSESNSTNSRFLLDPILPTEPADVRAQKLAFKADIRILNGTWYKRDASNPERLGTPIWSDHPGSLNAPAEDKWVDGGTLAIGQADLFGVASTVPRRYSYYVTGGDDGTQLRYDAPGGPTTPLPQRPVLSYGTLHREVVGTTPLWTPGYYELGPCGGGAGKTPSACPSGSRKWLMRKALTRAELLQATRSGYRDGWGEVGANQNVDNQQRENLNLGNFTRQNFQLFNMLPINFDVAAFSDALLDTSASELGSHFLTTPFNGIVWIGATWPGQLDGMSAVPASSGLPSFWPFQGKQADNGVGQPWRTGTALGQIVSGRPDRLNAATIPSATSNLANSPYQQALPYPLCANTDTPLTADIAGIEAAGTASGPAGFRAPACSRYQLASTDSSALFARPNIVRIINGRNLITAAFPKGLSIATNLGLVVLGDYNKTSLPSSVPNTFTASTSWRPAMLAGDTIALQSAAWEDNEAPWNVGIGALSALRTATVTQYNMQALAGWLVSWNGDRDEFIFVLRIAELWPPATRNIRGSLFIAFNSLFGARFSWNVENADDWGNQTFAYDYNLDMPSNQPPGAPMFEVTATERFRRN